MRRVGHEGTEAGGFAGGEDPGKGEELSEAKRQLEQLRKELREWKKLRKEEIR